jgi:post-segregation antitoxin (ccd killing protein)
MSEQDPMKIKIRPRLNAEMVNEARRLGLDVSRIVDEALVREIEAERHRRQVDRGGDHEGGDGTGSGIAET